MKIKQLLLCLCLCLGVSQRLAFGQQPTDTYDYYNLNAGIVTNPFGGYFLDDFIFSYLNESGSTIEVTVTITSTSGNSWGDCSVMGNTFNYGTRQVAFHDAVADNVLNKSVLADVNEYFTGSLHAESTGNEDFYMEGPDNLFVSGHAATKCAAYYAAWEGGSWSPGWYWDGNLSLLVSPYANVWHNHAFWDLGWNTSLSVYNYGSGSVTYTASYIGNANQYNPNSACAGSSLSQSGGSPGAVSNGGGSWITTLNDIFGATAGYDVEEDGALEISLSPVLSASYPSSNIAAFGSGSITACGGGCSESNPSPAGPVLMLTACY